MDKREFYKQLMSQYTFDEDRIRKNAKHAHSRSFIMSKWMPLASAAAVFIAVFASYILVPPLLGVNNNTGETEGHGTFSAGISAVSAGERLSDMEYNDYLIRNNIMSSMEKKAMYVSFAKPMTINELSAVLDTYVSDTGDVTVLAVWNKVFTNVGEADSGAKYLAAKINAPVSAYKSLIECSAFSVVDFEDKINDDNFEPLVTETLNKGDDVSAKTIETTAVTSVSSAENTVTKTPGEETTALDGETGLDSEGINEETSQTEELTAGPSQIKLLSIPVDNAVDVEFINDDHFIVLTDMNVTLYRITSEPGYHLVSSYQTANPKISYINWGTNTMVILGGERTQLFVADGATSELIAVDTSEITMDASIACAYTGGEDVFIKTVAADSSYNAFYLAVKSNEEINIKLLEQFTDKTSVIAFNNESFIYAIARANGKSVFHKWNYRNGTVENLKIDINGELSFVRSHDLTNFAVLSRLDEKSSAWIYSAQTGNLSEAFDTEAISFSEFNSDIFTDGVGWYELWGNNIQVITAEEAGAASNKPSLSSNYRINDITSEDLKFEIR